MPIHSPKAVNLLFCGAKNLPSVHCFPLYLVNSYKQKTGRQNRTENWEAIGILTDDSSVSLEDTDYVTTDMKNVNVGYVVNIVWKNNNLLYEVWPKYFVTKIW